MLVEEWGSALREMSLYLKIDLSIEDTLYREKRDWSLFLCVGANPGYAGLHKNKLLWRC